jgi:hypothetical protein
MLREAGVRGGRWATAIAVQALSADQRSVVVGYLPIKGFACSGDMTRAVPAA